MHPSPPLAIIVHGGAWQIPADQHEAHRVGCAAAAQLGWQSLHAGGSALDAVEIAIRALEDNPTFDAGVGSVLVADGSVELDAGLMDGETLHIGAVAALRHFANPIRIARRLLEASEHHLLVGPGAEAFALAQGFAAIPNEALVVERERALYEQFMRGERNTADSFGGHDTVGALALDGRGRLAAGNSTGGVAFSLPGRVGDAPLPGVGYYADSRVGAVACTGWGEQIMRVGLALRVMQALEGGRSAQQAADAAIALLRERVQGRAGLIVLDAAGRVGLAHSTACLAHAWRSSHDGGELQSGVAVGAARPLSDPPR